MAGISEECACGARLEVTEAHWTQAISAIKVWREQHKCPPKQGSMDFMAMDTSRSDIPMGFSRGLQVDLPNVEEMGDDDE